MGKKSRENPESDEQELRFSPEALGGLIAAFMLAASDQSLTAAEDEEEDNLEAEAREGSWDFDDDPGFNPEIIKKTGVKFRNLGGIHEIKGELQRIVRFLKEPRKFQRMGAKLPRGILLKGPPGTGKTMLARAMAQEAGVPFISVSGTEFDAHLHGIGPARIRKLINKAKALIEEQREAGVENPACLVYIDEIDVFCASRGGSDGNRYKMELMELCRLMDGFNPAEGLTVIASTNRPETLDPALVRPGRFDMSLEVPAPDVKGRLEILEILTRDRKIPLKKDVDLSLIAKKTFGFAGAELNLLINEAAMLAAEKPKAMKVGMAEFEKAFERVLKGPRRHIEMTSFEKESTAIHEAGHAIAGLRTEGEGMAKLRNVTILPHVNTLGTTYFSDDKESYADSYRKFFAELVVNYAGRVAEELAYGEKNISSGASGDIENATETAWRMVAHYGFNDGLGRLRYGKGEAGYLGQVFSEAHGLDSATAKRIYDQMIEITNKAYEEAKRILSEDYEALIALAQALREHETLDRDEVIAVTGIEPQVLEQESLAALAQKGLPRGVLKVPDPS